MFIDWSTDGLSPAHSFAQWREACCQHVYALTPERRSRDPFNGKLRLHCAGPLDVAEVRCDGHVVHRRPEDIRARPSDTYYIYLQQSGRAWFEQGRSNLVVEAGDMVIADPNVAFHTGTEGVFDFRLWRIERTRLEPLLAGGAGELPMRKVHSGDGEGALIRHWLDALLHDYPRLSSTALELAVGTLCGLVANVAGMAAGMREQGQAGRRRAQLQRVMHHVEQRAADPDFGTDAVTAEFAMSLRTLHQLFALSDCTFHEYLTQVRLRKAHALLHAPAYAHLNTTEIGFAAGFKETSTFYRRFKKQFGAAPGELRAD